MRPRHLGRAAAAARAALSLAARCGLALAAGAAPVAGAHASEPRRPPAFVDDARLTAADSEPGQWLAHGRTWSEQRFSPLTGIDKSNVGELGLAWVVEPGTRRGMEATPLVVDGVMYATGEWSRVYALDAASGKMLWSYDPHVAGAKGRDGCCDVVNRGVAAWKGRLYLGAFDGRLICLDAATGEVVWEKQTTDPAWPYTITGAPRVFGDTVVIGNGGAEFGVRGYFGAYDAATGELRWRFYTVPASSEGPFEHPELAVAAETWAPNSAWESGLGGTVWDSMAYDPELELLYVGTGNASVYNREQRSPGGGDNLYVSSILAIRPKDGSLAWHYQTTPGDQWDYTATQHIVLADLTIGGVPRKTLLQAPKNGFFYVLDRATGELLSAEPYADVSWATGVDLTTGRPIPRPQAAWSGAAAYVTPGIPGAHNWHPMAFSPLTKLVYLPAFESVYAYIPDPEFRWRQGAFNTSESWDSMAAEVEGVEVFARTNCTTRLVAWDPVAAREVWRVDHGHGIPAGVLATAGGLVFQGTSWGKFAAYDDATGEPLWEAETGTGIMAPPISYEVGGEQYVAVVAGLGGSQGGHYLTIPNANPGRILAFKLGARAPLPAMPETPRRKVEAPVLGADRETLRAGRALYSANCGRCHGIGAISSGLYPDLRYSSADVYRSWNAIVLGGAFAARGMASFADALSAEDAEKIKAYVADRARHEPGWVEWLTTLLAGRLQIPARWLAD